MIGIDITRISRFHKFFASEKLLNHFMKKISHPEEKLPAKAADLARMWALKEASFKCQKTKFSEILTFKQEQKPFVSVHGNEWPCSISHEGDYLIAVVLRIKGGIL